MYINFNVHILKHFIHVLLHTHTHGAHELNTLSFCVNPISSFFSPIKPIFSYINLFRYGSMLRVPPTSQHDGTTLRRQGII